MKRNHAVIVGTVSILLWLLTGLYSAQIPAFDQRKCQQELEIMKGILRTTLSFASQELATSSKGDKTETKPTHPKRFLLTRSSDFNIGAFYLVGQGAVFTIPTSSFRDMIRGRDEKMAFALADGDWTGMGLNGAWVKQLEDQINQLSAQLGETFGYQGVAVALAPPPPAAPGSPASPAPPPKPPAPPPSKDTEGRDAAIARERMSKKLAELQERVRQRGAEQDASQAKFRENLSQLKGLLLEAIANHGDSLTVVKPGEYINLVIVDEGNRWFADDSTDRSQREILSVLKSVVADYKAGKLSMDAFKQKVSSYTN